LCYSDGIWRLLCSRAGSPTIEYTVPSARKNLGYGRFLPVEVIAAKTDVKDVHHGSVGSLVGIYEHANGRVLEPERSVIEPEIFWYVHELREAWDGERELVEEQYLELLEIRGSHPGKNRDQVSANTSKPKPSKDREV
jgi:hypothetical protein